MNYFSLESKNLKLERNKAFSVVLMLLLYKEYGSYFDVSSIQSVQEALDTAPERDCEAYTFHIIYMVQFMKQKITFFFKYLIKYA